MIVDTVDLEVMAGEFLGIIGPNGSGKTSLISLLAGIRPPKSGTVRLEGRPLAQATRRDIAQRIALVEQQAETTERITARQAVELGRTPHLGPFRPGRAATPKTAFSRSSASRRRSSTTKTAAASCAIGGHGPSCT